MSASDWRSRSDPNRPGATVYFLDCEDGSHFCVAEVRVGEWAWTFTDANDAVVAFGKLDHPSAEEAMREAEARLG